MPTKVKTVHEEQECKNKNTSASKNQKGKEVIVTEDVTKVFDLGKTQYRALRGATTTIYEGDFTILYGASGSGKSTLLHNIIGLERPTGGKIIVNGKRIDLMRGDDRAEFRTRNFGVVYQQPIWIKSLTIEENVAMPLLISGEDNNEAIKKAKSALDKVGMNTHVGHKPTEISGGQQQRVGLARALINDPKILVLDEPTGNLDTHAADEVMQMLAHLNADKKRTILMVTHNLVYLPYANRTIMMQDGKVAKTDVGFNEISKMMNVGK